MKKCPSSKKYRDSNPQPLEHESPPITTRPGLPPFIWRNIIVLKDFVSAIRYLNVDFCTHYLKFISANAIFRLNLQMSNVEFLLINTIGNLNIEFIPYIDIRIWQNIWWYSVISKQIKINKKRPGLAHIKNKSYSFSNYIMCLLNKSSFSRNLPLVLNITTVFVLNMK